MAVFPLLLVATFAAATPAPNAAPLATADESCVARLVDVKTGSGEKLFASRYSFDRGWALGTWTAGHVQGQSLWRQRTQQWCKVVGSGGLDARDLQSYGVPAPVARRLSALQPPTGKRGHP